MNTTYRPLSTVTSEPLEWYQEAVMAIRVKNSADRYFEVAQRRIFRRLRDEVGVRILQETNAFTYVMIKFEGL